MKLWIVRKYVIELVTVKSYKKDLVFFCGKDLKIHQVSFPKASKVVFTIVYPI